MQIITLVVLVCGFGVLPVSAKVDVKVPAPIVTASGFVAPTCLELKVLNYTDYFGRLYVTILFSQHYMCRQPTGIDVTWSKAPSPSESVGKDAKTPAAIEKDSSESHEKIPSPGEKLLNTHPTNIPVFVAPKPQGKVVQIPSPGKSMYVLCQF